MQKLTKLSIIFLMIVASFFFSACGKEEEELKEPVIVTSIELITEELNILSGDTFTFEALVLPDNAENKAVKFYVQNTGVATINETTGVLQAVAVGSTTVVAQSLDGSNKFDYAQVRVYNEPVQLASPSDFTLEDNIITWSAVNDALSYVVMIDNIEQTPTSLTEYNITGFNATHTYKVQALGDNYTILHSNYTQTITAKILAAPANFSNNEDVISWDAVTGAESYELLLNGASIDCELETSIQLDLSVARTYEIKVRAIITEDNAYSSLYTGALSIVRLDVPSGLGYQSGGIVWQTVSDAINYVISINDEEILTGLTNYKLPSNAEPIKYTFKVKAVGDGDRILDGIYSVPLSTTKLETPQNLRVQEGQLLWDAVSLAQTYSLKINGQTIQVGEQTEYELLEEYPAGIYTVFVMANGNGNTYTNSNFSDMVSVTKLVQSSNVAVAEGVITWLAVPNATRYVLMLDEQEFITSNTYYNAGAEIATGEYTLQIRAEAENFLYSAPTASIIVEKLSVPTDFRIENGLLRWDSVSNAGSYEIVAGSNIFNSGILNGFNLPLAGNTDYNVQIRTKGDNKKYLNSEYTPSIIASKLAKPEAITLNNGYINIDLVENATGYILQVNGVPYIVTEEFFPYYLNATAGEEYIIKLLSRGDDSSYLNSDYSDAVSVYQLPQVQDVVIANSTISWSNLEGVQDYEIWIKLEEAETYDKLTDLYYSTTNSYDLTTVSGGRYTIKVRALGNSMLSLTGLDSEELVFEKLAMPASYKLKYGILLWDSVPNATTYLVEINSINGTDQEFFNGGAYILDESFDVGTYSIKVAAYGDGANYITSEWTDVITADRLARPENVRVVDGAVEWDAVTGATIYIAFVAGTYYAGTDEDLLTRFEPEEGYPAGDYEFIVYASSDEGFASQHSQVFVINKLNSPSNLRVENGIIKWDSVLEGDDGYRLVINEDTIDTMELSYDFSTYSMYEPNFFDIKVAALGDMGDGLGNSVNSDFCSSIPITVMSSPNGLCVADGLISWIPVGGAVDYELLVYEKIGVDEYQLLSLDTPLLTGDTSTYLLSDKYPAGEYRVQIRAIGDNSRYITSEYSNLIDVIKLDAPTTLSLINGLIMYGSVANSSRYEILAKDILENEIYASAGTLTTYELPEYFEAGQYDLAVRAIGDNVIYLTSDFSSNITAEKLEAIQNFRVENGTLKWSPNADASQYILNINYQDYLIGLVTSYELPNEFIQGNYKLKIKARGTSGDLLNSSYTEVLDIYKMDVVTNLRTENGIITWDWESVRDAANGYTIIIINSQSVETKIVLEEGVTSYILPPQFIAGDYSIYVQTNGDSISNINSIKVGNAEETGAFEVTKLETPTDIILSEANEIFSLSWTQVPLASKYKLLITKGGTLVVSTVEVAEEFTDLNENGIYDIGEEFVDANGDGIYNSAHIPSGQAYEIIGLDSGEHLVSVQAIGDDVDLVNSDFRAPIVVTKPSMPLNLAIANGVVSWSASTYATEYELTITFDEGDPYEEITANTYYYLTELGYYEVSVRASYSGSLSSDETTVIGYEFNLFNAGNGSVESPFEIADASQLNNAKYNPTASYVLVNDITLTTTNFEPIGSEAKPFIGVFNGDFKNINNLTINSTYVYAGMFGYVGSAGIVKNIYLNNANIISSSEYTGAIAGYSLGTIRRIVATGNIKPNLTDASKQLFAGGIIGRNEGTVEESIVYVSVEPTNTNNLVYAGGIAGYNNGLITKSGSETTSSVKANFAGGIAGYNNGNISEAYNKGVVLAQSKTGTTGASGYAGGIAGFNLNTDAIGGYTGLIINSYNAGNITATSDNASSAYAGGITGYNRYVSDNSYGEVKWSYSSGIISASNIYAGGQSYAGGVVGWNETSIKLIESYYLNTSATQVTFNESGINCSSKTSAEIKSYDFASLLNNKNYMGATIWSSVDLNTNAKLTWELNY